MSRNGTSPKYQWCRSSSWAVRRFKSTMYICSRAVSLLFLLAGGWDDEKTRDRPEIILGVPAAVGLLLSSLWKQLILKGQSHETMYNHEKKCFTLIECWCGCDFCGLIALLLPALSQARARAKAVSCSSIWKQLGMAWHYYADDNQDRFPIGTLWWSDPNYYVYFWPGKIKQYTGDKNKGFYELSKVYSCPFQTLNTVTSYACNTHACYNISIKRSSIFDATKLPLLFDYWDSLSSSPMNNYFSCPTYPDEYWLSWRFHFASSNAHGIGSNFLLADGHVESVPRLSESFKYSRRFSWVPHD